MTFVSAARRAMRVGCSAALCASAACADASDPLPPAEAVVATEPLRIDTLATGLVVPWGLATAPDGRVFVTERAGRLRVLTADGLRTEPLLTLPVHAEDPEWHPESGLMGIALDPDFATTGHAYVMATFARTTPAASPSAMGRLLRRVGVAQPEPNELPFVSHVLRLHIDGERVTVVDTIVRDLPAFHYHAGGAVAIGPDGKLYVTVGDVRLPRRAGAADARIAAVLRFERDGRIPADNPDPASPVWARGLRNTQALAWTADGTMLGVDHGPSGLPGEQGRAGRDELNQIVRGASYGWPREAGPPAASGSEAPLHWWPTAVAPAGIAMLGGSTAAAGPAAPVAAQAVRVVVARLRGGINLLSLQRRDDRYAVAADTLFPLSDLGRIRSLLAMPDGSLYATTSNRDIRGTADSLDDLVVRIRRGPPSIAP